MKLYMWRVGRKPYAKNIITNAYSTEELVEEINNDERLDHEIFDLDTLTDIEYLGKVTLSSSAINQFEKKNKSEP